MKTYDLTPDASRYYRQNGPGPGANDVAPGTTCKPTSTIMALDVAGWPVPGHGVAGFDPRLCMYKQPEDNLTALCRSPEADAYKILGDPSLKGTPGNEAWSVVAWALRKFYGCSPYFGPRWDWRLQEALWGIAALGRPFVPSTWLSKGGHVVMIAGFVTEQDELLTSWMDLDIAAVREIIVDDPYGLHLPGGGYDTERSGYHKRYSLEEWRTYWRGVGLQILRKE
jgi:hypothetical protein